MKVWLSRSRPGADRQAADIRGAGHQVVVAPVIAVEPISGSVPSGSFDIVIFVSEHAVGYGLPGLTHLPWFAGARVLAVGSRTADVLRDRGIAADVPDEPGTEGLLTMASLQQVKGRRVLVVAGTGGRATLGETLESRGADVQRLECYRRMPVSSLPPSVWNCDAVIAASGDGLDQVAALWLGAGRRDDVPVLVPSARVARRGVELGLSNLHDCGGADSDAWLRGLVIVGSEAS